MFGLAFPIAIGLSACLLFSLELMVGQLMLPLLGGAPSVWATTLGFFQVVLLLGYLYAHVSATRFGRVGPAIHLALTGAAALDLAFGPKLADLRFDTLPPVLEVLATLTVYTGLPAFVLCTTTPLVSAWLMATLAARRQADSPGKSTGDPYRLYVVSNAGSLLALLAYPFAIEPAIGLTAQRTIWNVGFVALFVVLGLIAAMRLSAVRTQPATPAKASAEPTASEESRPSWGRMLRWLALAAVPCGLLSAVTNFITADLTSAPFLWVGPLAVYLATFMVAFSARGTRLVRGATAISPAMATLLWIPIPQSAFWPVLPLLCLELVGLGVLALTLHGRLANDRPGSSHLTLFYLVVSAGGVVGGAFVGFLAPVVFQGVWEYPILLVAALVLAPAVGIPAAVQPAPSDESGAPAPRPRRGLDFSPLFWGFRARLKPYVLIGAACVLVLAIAHVQAAIVTLVLLLVGAGILAIGANPRFMATVTAIILVSLLGLAQSQMLYQSRDFFGVVTVSRNTTATTISHGTTNHGSQWLDPARQRVPRTYYVTTGPLGDVMTLAQQQAGLDIGVVGLGAGGIAAYERPNDQMTFFEIDPAVIEAARDPKLFTYLSGAPIPPSVVLGDGRVELRHVPDHTYDVLILDAFSGDAVPTHLLSVESLTDDLRVLKPGGLLLVHVSNRYYDLAPAVVGGAQAIGMTAMGRTYSPTDAEVQASATASSWVIASTDSSRIQSLAAKGWRTVTPVEPITDGHPDVMRLARFSSWLTGS